MIGDRSMLKTSPEVVREKAQSFLNGVTLGLMIGGAVAAAVYIFAWTEGLRDGLDRGYAAGVREIRAEAVERGFGHWEAAKDGTTRFYWRSGGGSNLPGMPTVPQLPPGRTHSAHWMM